VVNFAPRPIYPCARTPVPNENKAGWDPEAVWTFCRKNSVASTEIRTPNRLELLIVVIFTMPNLI
jgi:hypothetical protein